VDYTVDEQEDVKMQDQPVVQQDGNVCWLVELVIAVNII
jgi:hypothetical protein